MECHKDFERCSSYMNEGFAGSPQVNVNVDVEHGLSSITLENVFLWLALPQNTMHSG